MTRALAMLLSGMVLASGAETESAPESWRYNTRGRTDSGIALQESGDPAGALREFGTALGLSPGDPLLQYNAGTAAIQSADPRAVALLQAAVEAMAEELKPLVLYNLGNAFLGNEEYAAAIDAYKKTLRLAPESQDAKHNLELALRKLQQQRSQEENDQEQQEQQEQQQQQQQQSGPQEPQPQEQPPREPDPSSPLPDFEEQPDMTAEQAAAILEAVENLEREQRRRQALEQLKRAKGDRDW